VEGFDPRARAYASNGGLKSPATASWKYYSKFCIKILKILKVDIYKS